MRQKVRSNISKERAPAAEADRVRSDGPVTAHYTIEISGMHCQNCVNGVTRAINAIDGAAAKVSLKNNSAEVSCDRDVDKEKLKRAVEDAGFKVVSIS